jgi:hypothetical protein
MVSAQKQGLSCADVSGGNLSAVPTVGMLVTGPGMKSAVWVHYVPTFRKDVPPPSSGWKKITRSRKSVRLLLTDATRPSYADDAVSICKRSILVCRVYARGTALECWLYAGHN